MTRSVRLGQAREERGELGCGLDHLLEVVEQEEQLPLGDVGGEAVLGAERLGDRLGDEGVDRAGRRARPRRRLPCTRARASSAASSASRVLPVPPGPVSVTRRAPSLDPREQRPRASSASLPTKELAGRGRFVFEIVLSGGKLPSPSW